MSYDINPKNLVIKIAEGITLKEARTLINNGLYAQHNMQEITIEDDKNEKALYVIALYEDKIITSGRLCLSPPEDKIEQSGLWEEVNKEECQGRVAMSRGIVTLEDYWGCGIGEEVTLKREEIARSHEHLVILALIRDPAKKLYNNLGYAFLKKDYHPANELIGVRDFVFKHL